MKRIEIASSRIKSIGWENGTLEVEFNRGGTYQYSPVSEQTFNALVASPSAGSDIQAIINDKSITCKKIEN